MPADQLLDRLEQDSAHTLEAAATTGWDATVPGLSWDVRAVVTHLGAVHRWSTDIVGHARPRPELGSSRSFWPDDLTDDLLVDWFIEGAAALLDTLRSAPADLSCFTMLDDVSPREFWIRRQAHETAIHRADVLAAGGASCTFDPAFAQNGLAEVVGGFAREPGFASERPASLHLVASDGPAWRVTFGGGVNLVESAPAPGAWGAGHADHADHADHATVSGTSSDLYLWAWNRPAAVEVHGDASVAALWTAIAI